MKMRNLFISLFVILVILVFSPLILGDLGFSKDYGNENLIIVDLGYNDEVILGRFINTGNESLNLKIELVKGFEIADIVDAIVVVPANGKEELKVRVTVPGNASRGDNYTVGIKYTEASSEGEGMIVISTSNTINFPVLIQEVEIVSGEEKGISKNIIWIILGILVIIIVVVVIKFILKEKQTFSEPVGEV